MAQAENLANRLESKFKQLVELHRQALKKVEFLELELEKKNGELSSIIDLLNKELIKKETEIHELQKQQNLQNDKEIKQTIGKLIEEIDDCVEFLRIGRNIEKEKQ